MKVRCLDPYGYGTRPSAAVLLRWQQCKERNRRNRQHKLNFSALLELPSHVLSLLMSHN
jgi:hypothetical protein